MAASTSTREKLLSLLDDIELLSRELLQQATSGKDAAPELSDTTTAASSSSALTIAQILDSLVQKVEELKSWLAIAEEQAANQKIMAALKLKLERKNASILLLQKNLKEAESSLASAVYEARKKLDAIRKAEEKAISAEELIKFAHRISASGSVAAPPTWAPGDASRRPYPTDMEMRQGFLARNWSAAASDGAAAAVTPASSLSGLDSSYRSAGVESTAIAPSTGGSGGVYAWHGSSGDYQVGGSGVSAAYLQTMQAAPVRNGVHGHNKENEDVEMMSDSSSSSSSSDE